MIHGQPYPIIAIIFCVVALFELIMLYRIDDEVKILHRFQKIEKTYTLVKSKYCFVFYNRGKGKILKEVFWYNLVFYVLYANLLIAAVLLLINIPTSGLGLLLGGIIPFLPFVGVTGWRLQYSRMKYRSLEKAHGNLETVRDPCEDVKLVGDSLIFGFREQEIELKDISQIVIKFKTDEKMIPIPHGTIIIKTKTKKKHKQKHMENIFGIAERIVEEVVTLGLEPPVIWDNTIVKISVEKEEQFEFYRNHMKTGIWK